LIGGCFLGISQLGYGCSLVHDAVKSMRLAGRHPQGTVVQATQENSMAFFAKGKLIAAVGAFALCLLTGAAQAASCGDSAAGFDQWKEEFAREAKAAGVKNKGLSALKGARYASATIKADRAVKKAFSGSVDDFMKRRGGSVIISKGRSLKKANAALFDKIERNYGVPPGVLLAIWGMETGFGGNMGKQNTISAIVTLAYDCRRPAFFTPHAIAALKLVDRGALSADSVGAMHGEIGHTQFLPGNVLKYGVGSMNLRDKNTALMSTANFLAAHGWQPGVGAQGNMGAIAGWNAAGVYQQAIARIAIAIDGE
jgi:membrane-bound lytic murein transglycosylase B